MGDADEGGGAAVFAHLGGRRGEKVDVGDDVEGCWLLVVLKWL